MSRNILVVTIVNNRKKILGIFLGMAMFVTTGSFMFPETVEYEEAPTPEVVTLVTEDGSIVVEEVDMSTFSATEEDLMTLASAEAISDDEPEAIYSTADSDTIVYDELNGLQTVTFEDDWSLILVNKDNLIPDDYKVELGTIRGNIKCDVRIVDSVLAMIQAAREDGVILSICSPYRDYDRQVMLFNRKAASYMRKGYSEEEAYELASETVAIPGSSEHQIGLAFDFISNDYTTLDAGFADTNAGRWLKSNAADYGFILRYPSDKTSVTDIEFEPWHYRYVGLNASHAIMDNGLCLEEYVQQIGMLD